MNDKYYQLADYILNHHDKTSHGDKLCLSKQLSEIYNSGVSTAISLVDETWCDDEIKATLICGLENSKIL